jgi:hypothetical protein
MPMDSLGFQVSAFPATRTEHRAPQLGGRSTRERVRDALSPLLGRLRWAITARHLDKDVHVRRDVYSNAVLRLEGPDAERARELLGRSRR